MLLQSKVFYNIMLWLQKNAAVANEVGANDKFVQFGRI